MSSLANEDLVAQLDQMIEVLTERIVDQLHESTGLVGEELTEAIGVEKRLSRARRSLEKARRELTHPDGDQGVGEETLP